MLLNHTVANSVVLVQHFMDCNDLREAHARAMLQKLGKQNQDNEPNASSNSKERLWRWALRGIVIQ